MHDRRSQAEASQDSAQPLLAKVSSIFAESMGIEAIELEPDLFLLELGADSFTMMSAMRKLKAEFGVTPSIRDLFESHNTTRKIARFISERAPGVLASASQPGPPAKTEGHLSETPRSSVASGAVTPPKTLAPRLERVEPTAHDHRAPASASSATAAPVGSPRDYTPRTYSDRAGPSSGPVLDGSTAWVEEGAADLTPHQTRYLEEFVQRYTERTRTSKARAGESRPILCNSRKTSSGFRRETKELLYPIVGSRSQGAHFWDLDGNKYVDIAMGFGSTLFGHNPPFLKAALAKQLEKGIQIGPDSDWAFENAQLITDITGFDRVLFSNTGTEAVMAAVRIARAATGRDKIVVFRNSYHGHNDAVLVVPDPASDDYATLGMVPGIPQSAVSDTLVLPYGSTKPLRFIEEHAAEIAAIMVEPVRNYLGNENPGEFLRELREISERNGIVLIFDEVLVGFRIALGGAQEWFGVRADIATYGKAVAGGVPVGVVAGRSWCMDLVDGGAWRYGDESAPRKRQTYTAGTFCKHPLAMAATNATLKELLSHGPALQERLNRRTTELCEILDEVIAHHRVPIQIHRFGSNFRFAFAGNLSFAFQPLELDIFFYHVLLRGVYVWEGRTCFLSTAHTDDDINNIVAAVNGAIADMKRGGFWPDDWSGASTDGRADVPTASAAARTAPVSPAAEGAPSLVYESLCPIVSPDLVAETVEARERAAGTDDVVLPLTEDQKTLMLLASISPGAMMTNSQTWALRVRGTLDVARLEHAYQAVTDRHIGLRATIDEGAETQTFHATFPVRVDLIDYSGLGRAEAEAKATGFLQAEAERQYDLGESLHRLTVLQLDADLWLIVLSCNHITIDGVSVSVVYTELTAIYNAAVEGAPLHLSEPLGFDEFVRWRQRQPSETSYKDQEKFWLQRIGADLPVLDLPTDFARPAVNSFAGSSYRLNLGDDFFRRLKTFSRDRRYTYFMVVYAAFQILLYRLTSQKEMVIGVPFNGRTLSGSDLMVGFCSNIYPIVHTVEPHERIGTFLDRVKEELFAAYENQDYPFSSLIQNGLKTRDPSRFPFFSVSFNWDRLALPRIHGAEVSWEAFQQEHVKFDLVPNLMEVNDELTVMLEYNTSLFREDTIARFCSYYEQILQQVLSDPDQTVSTLGTVSDLDRENQLELWSGGLAPRGEGLCLHHLFEQQAEKEPDNVALGTEDGDVTYREVNERANRLARLLLKSGAERGSIVGLCFNRSVEQVVAMLATMKIGAAYLPLDPEYPRERLAYFVRDSGIRLVVAMQNTMEALPTEVADILCLDGPKVAQRLRRLGAANLDAAVEPEDRIYVIYTSGSTGDPKGVEVNHAGVVNLAFNWDRLLSGQGVDKTQRFGWNSSFSFDGSVNALTQCFMGRPLVLLQGMANRSPEDLWRYMEAMKVGVWDMTPSQLQVVLPGLASSGVARPPHPVVGGEAISQTLWDEIRECCNRYGLTAFNIYGPTECSVLSNISIIPDYERSNIGPVLNNAKAYVLDEGLNLMPTGAKGELYLGGVGVARGYLGKPQLTAERFVSDPFSDESGARLYRTGDLVRWLPDGTIEYIGRLDAQVKVRGYRVEIGEVESALLTLDCVKQAGVLHRRGDDGVSLSAYVVLTDDAKGLTGEEVRQSLKQVLPDFMVPSLWAIMDELPLNPNGKLDRRALQAAPITASRTISAPRTPTETVLCEIWRDVLGNQTIGVFDDFFVVGGHSLLAIRCMSRVKERLGASLTLPDFFGAPTVALLAEKIDAAAPRPTPPLINAARRTPLSPAQQGLWFLDQLDGAGSVYNIFQAYQLDGDLDLEALDWALTQVLARHESLRTVFAEAGGQVMQRILPPPAGGLIAHVRAPEVEDESFVRQQMEEAARQPFNLATDLMVRVRVITMDSRRRLLLLTFHHIAADGWSMGVFLQELQAFYAYRLGLGGDLPSPPELQYSDYARWQHEQLQGDRVAQLRSYFTERLAGAPSTHALPVDRPRPVQQSFRGDAVRRTADPALYSRLTKFARRQGSTPFIVLQTAFAAHLARWQRTNDIVMGTPTASRSQPETHSLVGNFVNTLVLRTLVDPAKPFTALLAENRRHILAAFEHQDLPFEMLVEAINPPRNMGHAPIFQIMFALAVDDDEAFRLGEAAASRVNQPYGTAKFDLTLYVTERKQGAILEWEYNTDLFDAATVSSLAESFEALLRHVVEAPDTAVGSLRLTETAPGAAEAAQQEPAFCIHERFEAHAAAAPAAPAVVFEGETVSYGALNARANQLARVLTERGVRAERMVGLCLDRSPEMIVAILAVLKAGGCYVPLDPTYPEARLQHMLEDSGVDLVLTQTAVAPRLPACEAAALVLDDPEFMADCAARNADDIPIGDVGVTPQSLAYMIYTSGSTGRPKGVLIEHRNLANLAVGQIELLQMNADKRVLQFSSFSFDASVFEWSLALCSGATLVMIGDEARVSGAAVSDFVAASRITHALVPPVLLARLTPSAFDGVEALVVGGEAWSVELARRWSTVVELYNAYGPTEGTVIASMGRVSPEAARLTIGRPVPNAYCRVVDGSAGVAPVGMVGELYIGGTGVARGYHAQADLSGRAFVTDPFDASRRVYRTGDLVRLLPSGELDFVGRDDGQVKVRGFRVELGEIEAAALSHPAVQQATASAQPAQGGETLIVLYVVFGPQTGMSADGLKAHLAGQVPSAMVPARIVAVDAIPQTNSGKIDRQALEAMVPPVEAPQPATEVELALVNVWRRVLRVDAVGATDDFFACGGHSLSATVLIAEVEAAFGVRMRIEDVFACTTVRSMARRIEQLAEGNRLLAAITGSATTDAEQVTVVV